MTCSACPTFLCRFRSLNLTWSRFYPIHVACFTSIVQSAPISCRIVDDALIFLRWQHGYRLGKFQTVYTQIAYNQLPHYVTFGDGTKPIVSSSHARNRIRFALFRTTRKYLTCKSNHSRQQKGITNKPATPLAIRFKRSGLTTGERSGRMNY